MEVSSVCKDIREKKQTDNTRLLERFVPHRRLIRVFPRRTKGTPDDELAVVNRPPGFFDEADEVHISVSFDKDIPLAENLMKQWKHVAPVSVGGPAFKDPGGEFFPGLYLKHGYTITSRGCPNACWFCKAWKTEGRQIREIEIKDGYMLQDSNLLARSKEHQEKVFAMLQRQPQRPHLLGMEAARLTAWHIEHLSKLKPAVCWFAYDTPDDLEPLVAAAPLLREADLMTGHSMCCYVLIGWKSDTLESADQRLRDVMRLGYFPQSMLYEEGEEQPEAERKTWKKFHREWANKVIVGSKMRDQQGAAA